MTVTDINTKRRSSATGAKKRARPAAKKAAAAKEAAAKRTATKSAPASRKTSAAAAAARAPALEREICAAVDQLLGGLELDDSGLASAAIARRLAAELDGSYFVVFVADDYDAAGGAPIRVGAEGKAIPALAKELRDVLNSIQQAAPDEGDGFIADLFSEVGDTADS